MKLEKITHDHLLTKWLKVIIFAILMLAPIFSVAIRCAYVVCNKNAYLSYSDELAQTTTTLTNTDQLVDKRVFNVVKNGNTFGTSTGSFYYYDISQDIESYYRENYTYDHFIIESEGKLFFPAIEGSTGNFRISVANVPNEFWFEYKNINTFSGALNNNGYTIFYTNYTTLKLDNVFDYSVAQLKQDQLFNWTQNTGVYTGVNAMTTGLGLTDGTIAILITYWTLLSIIYVIIDIVLEGFVALTHMILKKAS